MKYKKLTLNDYIKMPWKNGKGYTVEIAKNSDNCPVDRFNWRISMATIDQNSLFSNFNGYQRVISVLEGDGIILTVDDQAPKILHPFDTFFFSGNSQTRCALLNDIVKDFNLIFDPEKYTVSFQWKKIQSRQSQCSAADILLIFSASDLTINLPESSETLKQYESLHITPNLCPVQYELIATENTQTGFICCVIEISKHN